MLRVLTVAACALVVGGGFAIPRLGFATSAPPDKAAALQRLDSFATTDSNTEPVVPPDAVMRPISARMLGPASPIPIPPSVLRVRSGWLMSDGRTLVAVYAGAAGNDRSVGSSSSGRTLAPARKRFASSTPARGRALHFDLGGRGTLTRSSRTTATLAVRQRPRSSDQVSHPSDR